MPTIFSYGYNTEAFSRDLNARLTPKPYYAEERIDHNALYTSRAKAAEEALDFTIMIEACEAILDEYEPAFPTQPLQPNISSPPSKISHSKKQPPNTPFDLSRTMGSTMTLAVAKTILEQIPQMSLPGDITSAALPWYELLRDFYTSPDIFPLFRNNETTYRSWTKDEFFTYTNTFLATPVERNTLEAFLVFCSHTSDLFRITEFRRRVETIDPGWELCEENDVMPGLFRKVSAKALVQPRDIVRAEHMLRKYWVELGCGEVDRRCSEQELRGFLNRVLPRDQTISRRGLGSMFRIGAVPGNFILLLTRRSSFPLSISHPFLFSTSYSKQNNTC